jgi:hypothetical protein
MLSPTLPAWCQNIPDCHDSPIPEISLNNVKAKRVAIVKSNRSNSLMVKIKFDNKAKLRKIIKSKSGPPPVKRRQSSTRSYSSSEDDDDVRVRPPRRQEKSNGRVEKDELARNHDTPVTKKQKHPPRPVSLSPPGQAPTPTSKPRPNRDQRESHHQLLMIKYGRWSHLARKQKHESDNFMKQKRPLVAYVTAIDALLAYIVAFDYEDRAEVVMHRAKPARSWSTLVPYVQWLIKMLEGKGHSELIGLCYLIRALVHLRILSSYEDQTIKLDADSDAEAFRELAIKQIKTREASNQDFKRGMRDLGLEVIERKFPKTWRGRTTTLQPVSKHEGGYRPLEDPYYLPLLSFSSLQEGAAFGYAIIREWADRQNIECNWVLIRGLKS